MRHHILKSIAIDFKNHVICFMTDGQQGTETNPYLEKVTLKNFIPEKYWEYESFTWNFQSETLAVNQEFIMRDGCIMTKENFVPQFIIPFHGLGKRFKEFISIMEYEEFNLVEEMPTDLRKTLGLD